MLRWLKKKLALISGTAITMESHSGVGTFFCNDCGHTEHLHLFTHGFGPTSECTMGYQCQKCAKFVTFDSGPTGEAGLKDLEEKAKRSRCECGGSYARNKPIMCSKCKSVNVEYGLGEIT